MHLLKKTVFLLFFFLSGCAVHPTSQSEYILSTSLEILTNQLIGSQMDNVMDIAGEPDQHAVVMNQDAWVYVKPGTTDGRAILFDTKGTVFDVVDY